jgi:hypothetical protein
LPSVPTSRATRVTSPAKGEGVELVHHRVDGVLELEDFAAHVHRDLAGQVAPRHRGGDLGDVADLRGEVAGHRVDRVGQVLPGAGHPRHQRLAAQLAVGADLARHPGHFRGEGAQLIHHRVDGFLQLEDLPAHVHGDLAGQVAAGDRDGDLGDVADLGGEVAGHRVDALGEVLPDPAHPGDLGLPAQLAVGADLARHPGDLGREDPELLDHGVDDGGRAEELAFERAAVDVEPHGLGQMALRHRGDRAGHLGGGPQQVVDQGVDRGLHLEVSAIFPSIPVQVLGSCTEKSPARTRCSASSSCRRSSTPSSAGSSVWVGPLVRLARFMGDSA